MHRGHASLHLHLLHLLLLLLALLHKHLQQQRLQLLPLLLLLPLRVGPRRGHGSTHTPLLLLGLPASQSSLLLLHSRATTLHAHVTAVPVAVG
jgi:hypothetical protein